MSRPSARPRSRDEEQFRLITGFNDIFVSIAAAILLFAVGWIGQSIGQCTGLIIDRRRTLAHRPAVRRRDGLGPGAVLHRQAADGPAFDPACCSPSSAAFSPSWASPWCSAIGPDCVRQQQCASAASSARFRRAIAAVAAWIHWRNFRVPITIAAGAASVAAIAVGLLFAALGQDNAENAQERHPRLRPAARHRRVPVRDVVGRFRPRPPHPPLRRRLLAAPAGRADDRASGLHPARPNDGHATHRRRVWS